MEIVGWEVRFWLFIAAAVVFYVALTRSIVSRFVQNTVWQSKWYRALRRLLVDRWDTPQFRWTGFLILFVLNVVLVLLSFPTAPVLWVYHSHLDAKERRLTREMYEQFEQQRLAKERASAEFNVKENLRRAEARKQWFAEHRPQLYYNTACGITAVLRPADYEKAQKATAAARRDGLWEKEHVLRPAVGTTVFATQQGHAFMRRNVTLAKDLSLAYASWPSELDGLVERHKVELVMKTDIFVPFINETILRFNEQLDIVGAKAQHCTDWYLVDHQAPPELWPL